MTTLVNLVKNTNFPEVEGWSKGVVKGWSVDHVLTTLFDHPFPPKERLTMNRILIIGAAIAVAAGAFPTQAHTIIDQMATWLGAITKTITPGQQMALVIVAVLFVLMSARK